MRIAILFLLSILLCACSKQVESHSRYVEAETEELHDFYKTFLAEAESRGRGVVRFEMLTITIEKDIGTHAGICETQIDTDFDQNTLQNVSKKMLSIKISEGNWNSLRPEHKEMLMFHELGHCLLERAHLDDAGVEFEGYSYPISLMYKNHRAITTKAYNANREHYLDELFSTH